MKKESREVDSCLVNIGGCCPICRSLIVYRECKVSHSTDSFIVLTEPTPHHYPDKYSFARICYADAECGDDSPSAGWKFTTYCMRAE